MSRKFKKNTKIIINININYLILKIIKNYYYIKSLFLDLINIIKTDVTVRLYNIISDPA